MKVVLPYQILPQPDDITCGPTCLHSIYRFYGERTALDTVIREVPMVEGGGTLNVLLGCHALRRGYRATLFTFNLEVFDPTWFEPRPRPPLADRLRAQMEVKPDPKLQFTSRAYLDYLDLGGRVKLQDLTRSLIRRFLNRGTPILTGLSSTFLYRAPREIQETNTDDDLRGTPSGHFVVLCGYDRGRRLVTVADPWQHHPHGTSLLYEVKVDRVINAVLLGITTYDSNLLVLEPARDPGGPPRHGPHPSRG